MAGRASAGKPALLDAIRREIRAAGPVPFSRFMELALYHPELGYYADPERSPFGPRGDFFTASDVGDLFGDCLARQVAEMDAALGAPDRFRVVELGAGRGLLAADLRTALERRTPELSRRVEIVAVDRSGAMRVRAAERGADVRVESPERLEPGGAGLVVAVELFDALPVDRVRRRDGALREVRVGLDAREALVEVETAPSEAAAAEASRYGLAPHDGDEAEVGAGIDAELAVADGALDRGFVLVVDYGHEASELAGRGHRRGTLLAYHRHRAHEDLLARVGEQDLTAHVNLTALADAAAARGWRLLARTTQDRFLVANGILERFEADDAAAWRDPDRVRGRLRALQLIHPEGMGRTFKVVAWSKRLEPPPELAGLADPFAR